MGGCFSQQDMDSEAIASFMEGRKRLRLDRKVKKFIARVRSMLTVALPECSKIVTARDEATMFEQIVGVFDQVAAHHHPEHSTDERGEMLLRCCPQGFPLFVDAVKKYVADGQVGAPKGRRKRIARDIDLLQMIGLWFEADQDNSGELDESEIRSLLVRMNISISTDGLKALIAQFDKSGDGEMQFDEFYAMYAALTTVYPVSRLFDAATTRFPDAPQPAQRAGSPTATGQFAVASPKKKKRRGLFGGKETPPDSDIDDVASVHSGRGRDEYMDDLRSLWGDTVRFESIPAVMAVLSDVSATAAKMARLDRSENSPAEAAGQAKYISHTSQMTAQQSDVLSLYDTERFMRGVQRMVFSSEEVGSVTSAFFGMPRQIAGITGVGRRQFQNALLDVRKNTWLHPRENRITHDMSQPITHYFIDSSHNTYLTGNQLSSRSDAAMYTKCLHDGCRCVEIDCWNGQDGEPLVTHGHTMCTKISFVSVIEAIHEAAFVTSPYPVLLSLELHTNKQQSDRMAEIMVEIFGDTLATAADAEKTTVDSVGFSPVGLLHKILVKGKKQKVPVGADEASLPFSLKLNNLCFLHGLKIESPQSALKLPHYAIVSIDENKMELWEREGADFAAVNKHMMTRTYPAGTRVSSTNYHPQPGWNIGAQVVALNYQTSDFPMRLNRAKFLANGRSGYLLKPRCLRAARVPYDSYGDRCRLSVTVVCGVQLPRPAGSTKGEVIDPYVQLFITGIPSDDTSATPHETRIVYNNGFDPLWNETFDFALVSREMAILTLRVMERDSMSEDAFIGEASVPVSAIREGYRAVPLHNTAGVLLPSPSTVLVRIEFHFPHRIDDDDL